MQEIQPHAPMSLFISMFSATMSIILMADFHSIMSYLSAGVAIISGIFAARYYMLAAKEKKLNIKKLNDETNNK